MKPTIFFLFLFLSVCSIAQFGPQVEITKTSPAPYEALLVDIDLDGDLDIITFFYNDDKVTWHKNNGLGVYSERIFITIDVDNPTSVTTGDLDEDGDIDILITSFDDNRLIWCENIGGQFSTSHVISSTISRPNSVIAVDFDLDGDLDVVCGATFTHKILLYENLGNGNFNSEVEINSFAPGNKCIKQGDVNNDGVLDIIAMSASNNTISWYQNNGNLNFGTEQVIGIVATGSLTSIDVGDINGDGRLDVAASSVNNKIFWFENLGGTNFSTLQIIDHFSGFPKMVKIADVNGDGRLDVLVAEKSGNAIVYHENIGNGLFDVEMVMPESVRNAYSVDIGDVDNDGKMDLVFASWGEFEVGYFKNSNNISFSNKILVSELIYAPFDFEFVDIDNDGEKDILYIDDMLAEVALLKNLGAGNFSSKNHISNTQCLGLSDISFGDFDQDGDFDIVYSSFVCDTVFVRKNLGNGVFGQKIYASVESGSVQDIVVFDIDYDGDQDIIIGREYYEIEILENTGNGDIWVSSVVTNSENYLRDIELADVNNDGLMDIVGCGDNVNTSNNLFWIENLGNGSFSSENIIPNTLNNFRSITTADFDGDGDIDIVAGTWSESIMNHYVNDGLGNFILNSTLSNVMVNNSRVISGDIDSDGDIDIVAASHQAQTGNGKISWFENLGNNNFAIEAIVTKRVIFANDIELFDYDHDGDLDLFSISYGDDKIAYYDNFFGSGYSLEGYAYYDENQNKIKDSSEFGIEMVNLTTLPGGLVNYSNYNGFFQCSLDTGSHVLSYDIQNSNWDLTTDSTTFNRTLSIANKVEDSLNFGFYPNTFVTDLSLDLSGAFPTCGDTTNYWIQIGNVGTTFPRVMIELILDDSIEFVNTSYPIDSIVGQSIFMHIDSIYFYSNEIINLNVLLPPSSQVNDTLISNVLIHEIDNSNNIISSYYDTLIQKMSCSIVSNEKIVEPVGFGIDGYINNNEILEYTIRFQNTGMDTITNVVIRDLLSDNLDWSSFNFVSSNFPVSVLIEPDGELVVRFDSINLPDSTVNYLGSQGFFKYRINQLTGLLPSTQIFNKASLYFDDEAPLITNDVLNTIYDCGVSKINLNNNLICFNDELQANSLEGTFSTYTWEIDSFVFSTDDTLMWVADSSGTFNLKLTISNNMCTKDTNVSITVFPEISNSSQVLNICEGDSVYTQGAYQKLSGIYLDVFPSSTQCDSTVETTLFVNQPQYSFQNMEICDRDSVLLEGAYRFTNGVYYDIVQSVNTCDSTIETTLFVKPSPLIIQNISICSGDSMYVQGDYQFLAGVYYDTLQAINSCDSIIETNLSVIPNEYLNQNISICMGDSLLLQGAYQSMSGLYYDTLQAINSCDSIIETNLTVNPIEYNNQNINICFGDSVIIQGAYQLSAGLYYDTLQTVNSCDSIISTNLTVNSVDISTSTNGLVLGANLTTASYQWLDCGTNYSVINGEVSQTFVVSNNGSYAVEITDNGCVDTSLCVTVSNVSLDENPVFKNVVIYPNPNNGIVNIELGELRNVEIKVYSQDGKLVYSADKINSTLHQFDLNVEAGTYVIELITDSVSQRFKLIRE